MKKLLIIGSVSLFLMACGSGATLPDSNTNSAKNTTTNNISNSANSPEANQKDSNKNQPSGKRYSEMSEIEQREYILLKAQKVASMLGNQANSEVPPLAIDKIKNSLDAYVKRVNVEKKTDCRFGDNLQATFERAGRNASSIIQAFNQEGVEPQIGIYLAMIESEHCVCVQSPTGPLGLFQLTQATAETNGIAVIKGASPSNPDDRCQPELASKAAAKHLKALSGRYGPGPANILLSIVGFNSGEDGLSNVLKSKEGLLKEFWSLIADSDKLSKQFQTENFRTLPKFFAAAIIGENPVDFGLTLQPLSTYSK